MPRPKKGVNGIMGSAICACAEYRGNLTCKHVKEFNSKNFSPAHSPLPCNCRLMAHTYPHPLIQCNEQICPLRNGIWLEYCENHKKAFKLFPELLETLEAFHMYCKVCKDLKMQEHCIARNLLRRCREGR